MIVLIDWFLIDCTDWLTGFLLIALSGWAVFDWLHWLVDWLLVDCTDWLTGSWLIALIGWLVLVFDFSQEPEAGLGSWFFLRFGCHDPEGRQDRGLCHNRHARSAEGKGPYGVQTQLFYISSRSWRRPELVETYCVIFHSLVSVVKLGRLAMCYYVAQNCICDQLKRWWRRKRRGEKKQNVWFSNTETAGTETTTREREREKKDEPIVAKGRNSKKSKQSM